MAITSFRFATSFNDAGSEWVGETNAFADNGSFATWTDNNNGLLHNGSGLQLSAFGFSSSHIPSDAHIDGFKMRVGDYSQDGTVHTWGGNFPIQLGATTLNLFNHITVGVIADPTGTANTDDIDIPFWNDMNLIGTDEKRSLVSPSDIYSSSTFVDISLESNPSDGTTTSVDYVSLAIYYHEGFPAFIGAYDSSTADELDFNRSPPHLVGSSVYAVTGIRNASSGSAMRIAVKKSSTPSGSWTELDSSNAPTFGSTSGIIASVVDGNDLHIVSLSNSTSSSALDYYKFNTSTDTWTTSAFSTLESGDDRNTNFTLDLVVRPNGDIVVIYSGVIDRVMGGDKNRVDYALWNGTSWSVGNAVDAAGDIHYGVPTCFHGTVSNDVHLAWLRQQATANDPPTDWDEIQARTLRANDTLSTTSSYDTGTATFDAGRDVTRAIDIGGSPNNQWLLPLATAAGALHSHYLQEDGSNDITVTSSNESDTDTNAIRTDSFFSNGKCGMHSVVEDSANGDLYLVYSDDTNNKLYLRKSTDGGASYATAEALSQGTPDQEITSVSAAIYTRSGSKVIGYLFCSIGLSYYSEYTLTAAAQTISVGTGIASGEVVPSQTIALSTRQSISAAGGIATGESLASDHTIANVFQSITSAGGIATGESLATDHDVNLRLRIEAAGAIASGESLATDHTIANVFQSITSAGAIPSGESFATDHDVNLRLRIEAAGAIASGESLATDHSLTQPFQTITSAGAIASGESLATDHSIANVFQTISSAGAIASGESFATDHSLTQPFQTISSAGGISTSESLATDHDINLRLRIEAAGAISTGESLATDHQLIIITNDVQNAGDIASNESFATDHAITNVFQSITDAGAIASGESFATDHSLTQPFQTISSAGGVVSGESFATDHDINLRLRIEAAGAIASGESLATDHTIANVFQSITDAGGIASGESLATDHTIANVFQSITDAGAIPSGESLATDHDINLRLRIEAAGGISTAESLATDHSLTQPFQTISSAGAISTGESLATDHQLIIVSNDVLNAGDIASGESFATDHAITNVFQSISDAGAIASGEAFQTDHDINLRLRIEAAGGIASGESLAVDHTVALSTPQSISAAGGIASGESLASDHTVALSTRLSISAAGGIISGEVVPSQTIANVVQEIIASGIASAESFATDHNIVLSSTTQTITNAGSILSGESFATDHSIQSFAQFITVADGILSAEAFEVDNQVTELLLIITQAGAIPSAEQVPGSLTIGDAVLDNPTPDGLYVHGTGLGLSGQIYAVQVAKTFGGAPTDVFLAGTRHTVSGAMYITFDSPDASAVWINGILHTPTGIRYCVDAIGSDKWPEGFATDAGSLTITTSIGGFYLRAIRRTIDGRMVIDL